MRRSAFSSLSLVLAVLTAVVLTGCDSTPGSIDEFEVQPNIRTSSDFGITFIEGQTPAASVRVIYQGLDDHPSVTPTGDFLVERLSQSGTPMEGEQVWAIEFGRELPTNTFDTGTLQIESSRGGQAVRDSVALRVNDPVTISEDFGIELAGVADFEDDNRSVTASGGATAQVNQETVSENSTGLNALRVTSGAGGSVTVSRPANLPNDGIFSFILLPDPSTDFNMTLTFTEEADGGTATYEVDVPVESGSNWRKYDVAAAQLFGDLNPVAVDAGGNGLLQSVSFSPDANVTFSLDDMAFGNAADGPRIEFEDFERTSNAYGVFGNIQISDTENVGPFADGPTGRQMVYSTPGEENNFFGYNYNLLKLDPGESGNVALQIGQVSRTFELYVFLETRDGAGGFTFGNGTTVEIEAGSEFREVTVPISNLGGEGADPSQLKEAGLSNVGFEIRRVFEDGTETISFVIDNIRLEGS